MDGNTGLLPARGNDAIDILVNDHQIIKGLLNQLSSASDTQARKGVLEQLKGILTIHNATEENLVYPALQTLAGKKAEAEHLYHETAEADVLVFEMDTMLKEGDDAKFDAKAKKFVDAVLEHIDDEEKKSFPHLRDAAEPRQAQLLTESVREFRNSLRFIAADGRAGTSQVSGYETGKPTPISKE